MAGRFAFMNGYSISRSWWDFAFANPEKVKPIHAALLFFAVEHCNRLGWKEKFGLPSSMAMEAIGVHSYNTYISAFNNLCEWGFFELVQKSKNQYSSNIIALSKFDEALDKALDKALTKHATKQSESTIQSIDSIDKQRTKNKEQLPPNVEEVKSFFIEKGYSIDAAVRAYEYYAVNDWKDKSGKKVKNWKQKMISVWFKPENKKAMSSNQYTQLT